jgi:tetratricopeptide (TPR) repeat protein
MEQFIENKENRYSLIYWILICIFLVFSVSINAQSEKKLKMQGNRQYDKNNFSESEIAYRRAIDKNKQFPDAVFNIGDALYKQKKYEDAGKQFIENANINEDKEKKSAAFFNLGNSLLNANKLKESIDAYKGSLKLQPENIEAKYNLAYAQDLLRKQEEQQKKDQDNKNQNKDEKKDNQNKDQKDQSEKEKNKDQQNDQKNQQQQQQEQNISKEDAERLLNAIANDEKNVQEKVKLAKAAKTKVRTVKNW